MSTCRNACSDPACRIVVPSVHSAAWHVRPLSWDCICSNATIRLASRGCSRPSGRRVTANTRAMSGASRSAVRARPPTNPLAPASNTIFGSFSAICPTLDSKDVVSQHKRVTIPHNMRVAVIAAMGLLWGSLAAVTDADRVRVYHDFRAAFDARKYPDALPFAEKLVALTEEQ